MTAVSMHCFKAAVAALLFTLAAGPALAHKASDAYLQLDATPQRASLRVDVALRDLDLALDLDTDADGRLTWGEVRTGWPAIEAYLRSRVEVASCALPDSQRALERRIDGIYAALTMSGDCSLAVPPAVRYAVLGDVDATHRGIASVRWGDEPVVLQVLAPTGPTEPRGVGTDEAASFLREGIHHIVTGYDHVLFLMCLLLPAAMRRGPAGWRPVQRLREAALPVFGIVTAFTLAHSITLALAALKWISLPPSFIEPAIAATIVLAAIDNLRSIFGGRRVLVAFGFGLIHGFGFAGVLGELDLPGWQFARALFEFNLGLELGQLVIVAAATTGLFLFRRWPRYPAWAIRGGSAVAMLMGALWFVERTADLSLLPL
jgi:hypothetical protein